jgi:flagellar biosynthesis/type III secretory pathway M-ring protein FliF/YscJ
VDSVMLLGSAGKTGAVKDESKEEDKKEAPIKPKIDIAALEELVKNAVGFSAERGDRVVVKAIPFVGGDMDANVPGTMTKVFEEAKGYLTPLLVFAFGIVALMIWRKRNKKKKEAEVIQLPQTVRELETGTPETVKALGEGDQAARDLANAAAEHDARRAAAVLRAWIAEG